MTDSPGSRTPVSVRIADLQAIEASVRTAHQALLEQTEASLVAGRLGLAEWSDATDSRRSLQEFERELTRRVEILAMALARVADEVAVTLERAHDAEARALAAVE